MTWEHSPYNGTNYEFGFADIEAPQYDNGPTVSPTSHVGGINIEDVFGLINTNVTMIIHVVKTWWNNGSSTRYSV